MLKKIQRAGIASKEIVVEGEKLITEALAAGLQPQSAWYTEPPNVLLPCESFLLPASVYQSISPTKSARPPLAVFTAPEMCHLPSHALEGAWLLLDNIQDPGNAGTLVRAALAFGFDGVLWHQPSVYPFLHSCIRASAGAVFKLKHRVIASQDEDFFDQRKLPLIVASLHGENLTHFKWPNAMILAMGNEGHGFSDPVERCASHRVRISIESSVESLNVGGAGHILMHHYATSRKPEL